MGAANFQLTHFGKDAGDAFRAAVEEANEYYGHRDGYSGTINSSRGYRLVQVPLSISAFKWASYVEGYEPKGRNTHIPKGVRDKFLSIVHSQWKLWEDKWDSCLCFELTGKDLRDWKAKNAWSKGKHGKPYMFTGMVPE